MARFVKNNKYGFVHGHTSKGGKSSPEYSCWSDIKGRCLNPKHKFYKWYGGRGITICEEWKDDFAAFLCDVGTRPTPKHTIDRHPDNNGPYAPGNIRWATRMEQVANRRSTRFVTIAGNKVPLAQACRDLGVSFKLVTSRLDYGWTAERAISEPPKWTRPDLAKKRKTIR